MRQNPMVLLKLSCVL